MKSVKSLFLILI